MAKWDKKKKAGISFIIFSNCLCMLYPITIYLSQLDLVYK